MFECVFCSASVESDEAGVGVNKLGSHIILTPVSAGQKHVCNQCLGILKGGPVHHPAYVSLTGTMLANG